MTKYIGFYDDVTHVPTEVATAANGFVTTDSSGTPQVPQLLYGNHNDSGTIPAASTTAGWAVSSNYNGFGEVDFWSTVNADGLTDQGFYWNQRTATGKIEVMSAVTDGATFAQYQLGKPAEIGTAIGFGSDGTIGYIYTLPSIDFVIANGAAGAATFLITAAGYITTGKWRGTTIEVAYGGTGQTTYTNGQLLIGNTTGNTLTKATLTAPAAGISITNGTGSITFGLANDLSALEAMSGTGLVARTASETYAQRTITGTASRISITNGDGVSGNPTIDIHTSYVGQTSITTLGTIATGTWQGTKIGLAYGGTNADLSATGGSSQVLKQVTAGAAVTVGQLAASDLSNGTTGSGSVVLATSPTLVTPALGTPSSGTLTSCTGLPISTGVSGLGSNVATFLATPSSANLAAAITDETGSSTVVFSASPTFTGNVGVGAAGGAQIHIRNGASAAAWTTSGISFRIDSATFTDTSSSGTVAEVTAINLGQPTFAASSSTTYTQAETLRIGNVPVAGTNVTITNSYSLSCVGAAKFAGAVTFGGSISVGTFAQLTGITFASRPSAAAGIMCYFTDSTTTTWGATITGGGANKVLGWYNGTNWTVFGA